MLARMYPLLARGKLNRALAQLAATDLTVEEKLIEKIRILTEARAIGVAERRTIENPAEVLTKSEELQAELDSMVVSASGMSFEEEVDRDLRHAQGQLEAVRVAVGVKKYPGGFVGTLKRPGDGRLAIVTPVLETKEAARQGAEEFVWASPGFWKKEYDWDEVDAADPSLHRISRLDPATLIRKRVV